jgi:membrane-associated protease RseP (regulator of RpoE activity)
VRRATSTLATALGLGLGLAFAVASGAAQAQPRRPRPTPAPRPTPTPAPTPTPGPIVDVRDRADPPFLGIEYGPGFAGIRVRDVSEGSGAAVSGLRAGDEILAIDGVATTPDVQVALLIQRRHPGERLALLVLRDEQRLTLTAELSTRGDVLHRRLVGHPAPPTGLVGFDDDQGYDLGAARGQVTIVGWFTPRCDGCAGLFSQVAGWAQRQPARGPGALVLAATTAEPVGGGLGVAASPSAGRRISPIASPLAVPLALAERSTFTQYAILDDERATFVVIDGRGVIRFVCEVRPGEGAEAAIDEVLGVAEQAVRRPASRP